jgi:tetratricopeptide (TPR) repeat protein
MSPAWAVATLAALAYLPSLAGPFQFDDYNVIVHYPTVHSWGALFEHVGSGVRPLLKASYTFNWTLEPSPMGFHAVNIGVHALNAALLFLIGERLSGRKGVALAAAILFALHPMQTEAVTYISGRSSSVMATFYLGAMLWYLRGGHWLGSTALFVLALATRETAVTLPVALLLCEFARRTPLREALRRQAPHWLVLAAAGVVVALHERYSDLVAYGFGLRSMTDNLITQVGGVSYLVSRLLGLHGLNIDPGLPTLTQWTPVLAFQATLLATLAALGVANLRSRPWIGFGILWFFLQLAPTNSLVPRLDVANDRQVYLACWGLFLALAVELALPKRAAVAVAASLAVVFAAFNVVRQLDYRDEISLWEASVREAPWNARARNNLGYAYYEAGRKDEALRELRAALFFDPQHAKAKANLALLVWD